MFKVLFAELYVTVVFVTSSLCSAATLTLATEQCFIRNIYYYHTVFCCFPLRSNWYCFSVTCWHMLSWW